MSPHLFASTTVDLPLTFDMPKKKEAEQRDALACSTCRAIVKRCAHGGVRNACCVCVCVLCVCVRGLRGGVCVAGDVFEDWSALVKGSVQGMCNGNMPQRTMHTEQ